MTTKSDIAVIMAVNKNHEYFQPSIESILGQSFSSFELIIVDDGADLDPKCEFLKNEKIHIIKNSASKGLAYSLNVAISNTDAKYIARMDADDVSHKNRLSEQFNFMERNPHVDLVGCQVQTIGKLEQRWRYPLDHDEISVMAIFENPVAHPAVLFRRDVFNANKLKYDETILRSQDFELWSRCLIAGLRFANLPDYYLNYRIHDSQSSMVFRNQQLETNFRVYRTMLGILKIEVSSSELEIHNLISLCKIDHFDKLKAADLWLCHLLRKNQEINAFDSRILFQFALKKITLSLQRHPALIAYIWNLKFLMFSDNPLKELLVLYARVAKHLFQR